MGKNISPIKLIVLFIVCQLTYSCDIFSFAVIVNKTSENVIVKIHYDKESLEEILEEDKIIPYLESLPTLSEKGGTLVYLDTENLIAKYKMKPNDSLEIDSNRGSRPYFKIIKDITIFAHDTIKLTRDEIDDSLIETEDRIYIMEIK